MAAQGFGPSAGNPPRSLARQSEPYHDAGKLAHTSFLISALGTKAYANEAQTWGRTTSGAECVPADMPREMAAEQGADPCTIQVGLKLRWGSSHREVIVVSMPKEHLRHKVAGCVSGPCYIPRWFYRPWPAGGCGENQVGQPPQAPNAHPPSHA